MTLEAARVAPPLAEPRPRWKLVAALLLGVVAIVSTAGGLYLYRRVNEPVIPPPVGDLDVFASLFDVRPVTVRTTIAWEKLTETVPRWRFLADRTIWLRMHFEDWDQLPADLRAEGLGRMLDRYGRYAVTPALWTVMTADDWDQVPQPIRAMAFVSMIEHWVQFYAVGEGFDLDQDEVLRTVKAIAMSESWFDHRSFLLNTDGSVDIGIAGASAYARRVIRRWSDSGRIDFSFEDGDYFNPYNATRFLAFWFQAMLEEADGDLPLAIRAYNWGIGRARAGFGAEYLDAVERRRRRYFNGPSGSFTWRLLSQFRRENLPPGMPALPQPASAPPPPVTARVPRSD
jgi:hypothetical protein